jgi:small GTP-binding protein
VEQLTPSGLAGVAVVRVAANERARVVSMLRTVAGAPVCVVAGAPPRRVVVRSFGVAIDDALLVDRGAAGLELHLHAAPAVLDALHREFGLAPASSTPAHRLLQSALGVEQLDLALEQIAFDFPASVSALLALPTAERNAALASTRERSRQAAALSMPMRVTLVGCQNAGKSSLFNRLLFRERVLTGPVPGLTRDPVAEVTTLAGYPYELVDTAGEGPTASALDAEAIDRGRALRAGSIVVLVVDAALGPTRADLDLVPRAALVVANKTDLPHAPWPADVPCHASLSATAEDAAALRSRFGRLLQAVRGLPPAGPVGGFAALDAQQWLQLAPDDCSWPPGSA